MAYYLAIDIGASGGRHILGCIKDNRILLEEVYRFENGMEKINGTLCWNTERIFREILTGMKKCKELGKIPVSVGIDTWGVDFVLLDSENRMLGPAVGYRDKRTQGIPEEIEAVIPARQLYERTGVQSQVYNTLYQLAAVKKEYPELLMQAQTMLMSPDYYHFLLTGIKKQEYTIATTSQLVNASKREWDYELIRHLGLPERLFDRLVPPGTTIGSLQQEVKEQVGYDCQVVTPASHDTAAAVTAIPSTQKDVVYISSGTWSLMGIEAEQPNCSEACRKAGLTNEGGYDNRYTLLKNIMGLWMIQSVRREIGEGRSYAEICKGAAEEKIASIVDCNAPDFLAPDSMVIAIREYCRKTGQQIPEGLYETAAVIYNSLAQYYAATLTEIESLTGKHYDSIHIIGGGSNATYLNQLTEEYTGRKVIAGPTEATAIGNLICQMLANREFTILADARRMLQNDVT